MRAYLSPHELLSDPNFTFFWFFMKLMRILLLALPSLSCEEGRSYEAQESWLLSEYFSMFDLRGFKLSAILYFIILTSSHSKAWSPSLLK